MNLSVTTHNRIRLIDAMKGFAIILVVLGNYIQVNDQNFAANLIWRVIYSFHMPLFFFLSGYLAKPGSSTYLSNKFTSLVIPFLCWHALNYIIFKKYILYSFETHMVREIISPGLGLWFLWTVFFCHCVLWLCLKDENRFGNYALLLGVIVLQVISIKNYFGLLYLKDSLPFLIAGYLVFKYKESLMDYKPIIIIIAIVFFPILSAEHWIQPLSFFPMLQSYVLSLKVHIEFVQTIYKLITACLGIVFIYALIKYLISFKIIDKILCWFGLYTFEIYVTHGFFLKLGIGNGLLQILSTFIIATIFPLLIAILLKKIPALNVCLYGPSRIQPFSVPK